MSETSRYIDPAGIEPLNPDNRPVGISDEAWDEMMRIDESVRENPEYWANTPVVPTPEERERNGFYDGIIAEAIQAAETSKDTPMDGGFGYEFEREEVSVMRGVSYAGEDPTMVIARTQYSPAQVEFMNRPA